MRKTRYANNDKQGDTSHEKEYVDQVTQLAL
jgi:hypothetical protein